MVATLSRAFLFSAKPSLLVNGLHILLLTVVFFIFLQHFSNAGFPCPIMQSPSDHFLRAINTDFDRIIAMCKNWQVIVSSRLMIVC